VRARTENSALLAHDFPVAVAKCVAAAKRSSKATMMKSDNLILTQYAPARRSIKLVTRTQRGSFRLPYAAVVAMAFVSSGLAPAVLMALIWHETSFSLIVFAVTFLVASVHAIGLGLPLFLIGQWRGWINLVSCVVLGAFIGISPLGILAHPTSGFIVGAWTNGVPAAIWADYIKPLIYFGLLGAWGGFVFWAVLKCWAIFDGGRQNLPNSSLKPQASTATPPPCIARKPAAPHSAGVLTAAVPDHSRRMRPVAYQGELIRRYNRARQGVASNE
jgi:hypothetical protein